MTADNTRGRRTPLRPIESSEELDDELAQHMELLVAHYLQRGLSASDARAAAHARFGDMNQVHQECAPLARTLERRSRAAQHGEAMWHDVRFSWRSLRRAPLFAAVAILTLAVAIGANTAMFSVVHAVLFRALPYTNAERVDVLINSYPGTGLRLAAISPPEFVDMREALSSYDAFAAYRPMAVNISGACAHTACEPIRASGYIVSPNLFTVLGASPALGRAFVADDGAEGAPEVAMISHDLWINRFGGDSAAVGQTVSAAGVVRTIVGIMPKNVRFPDAPVAYTSEPADIWLPYNWERDRNGERGNQYLIVLARSAPGATPQQHQADVALLESRFKQDYPQRYTGPSAWNIAHTSLRSVMTGDVRPALLLLWAIVAMVLLIACANVANLLLARGASRAPELAIRAALGAGRGRLVRQLVVETLLIGVVAAVVGVSLAALLLQVVRVLGPSTLPQLAIVHLNTTVVIFALATALIASGLCGLFPAMQVGRTDMHTSLRSGTKGSGVGRKSRTLRRALVVGELALTLTVLVNAALLIRTFRAAQQVAPPYNAENLLTFEIALPRTAYADRASVTEAHRLLQQRLSELPGATEVSAVYPLPLTGGQWSGSYYLQGQQPAVGEISPNAQYNVAMPEYFRTMGITIREGREFTTTDMAGRGNVLVVNEAFAERHWPNESAIGKRVNTMDDDDDTFSEVVGVVANVQRLGVTEPVAPQIYLPLAQRAERTVSFVVRTTGVPTQLIPMVREAVRTVDPLLPLARLAPMSSLVNASVAPQRFNASVLAAFALVALILAGGGLFGVISYLVSLRQHELGVRMALGGRPRDVVKLVLADGMSMAFAGVLLGSVGAWLLTRALRGILYGVSPNDPATWIGVPILLLFIALLASWVPAKRATKIDPVRMLRGT